MDKLSLAALLDDDREMILSNLARDRSLPAAQATLEKAVDRVMYRYTEAAESASMRDGAQYILQSMKNALPLIDAVGEARNWKKELPKGGKTGLNFGPMQAFFVTLGTLLILASVLAVMFAGHLGGVMAFVKALVPTVVGCGMLLWAGVSMGKPKKQRQKPGEDGGDTRTEFLVDADKAYHVLRGAMLQADGQLDRLREELALDRQTRTEDAPGALISTDTLELLSQLLEAAYAAHDDAARESAAAIRFYLHNAQVDVVDYEPGRESWFEFLPAEPGTLRPALVCGGKLLKKGMAAR